MIGIQSPAQYTFEKYNEEIVWSVFTAMTMKVRTQCIITMVTVESHAHCTWHTGILGT